jgi:hypothetical protein
MWYVLLKIMGVCCDFSEKHQPECSLDGKVLLDKLAQQRGFSLDFSF